MPVKQKAPTRPPGPPAPQRAPAPPPRWEKRRSVWPAVLAVLLAAGAGGFALGMSLRDPPPLPQALPAAVLDGVPASPSVVPSPLREPDPWREGPAPGELCSAAAFLMRAADGAAVYTKNPDQVVYPASLTKMMTVLVVLDRLEDLDEVLVMPEEIYEPLWKRSAALAGFLPGEEVTVRDLLYGAMLPSGAECCEALAIRAAGGSQAFVDLMNQKAAELGLGYTHFTNVTGLHDDMQYTSVRDMAALLRRALEQETFRQVFTTPQYTVPATNLHPQGLTLRSSMYKGLGARAFAGGEILGGKTGFTDEASLCFASLARVNGEEYILVTVRAEGGPRQGAGHIQDALLLYGGLAQACLDP